MNGIHPNICEHHIYIKEVMFPIRQQQRIMNPTLKDVFKTKLQKLLDARFIYPISDSEWVSLLVVVPKKNGKWRICVDYRELNKTTKKECFQLPFINQVLDTLSGKITFLSHMDLVDITKFKFILITRTRPHSFFHGAHLLTKPNHLGYVMPQQHFKKKS